MWLGGKLSGFYPWHRLGKAVQLHLRFLCSGEGMCSIRTPRWPCSHQERDVWESSGNWKDEGSRLSVFGDHRRKKGI